jgi:hypothetical protein
MAGDFWGQTQPPAGVLVDPSHPLASGLVLCLPLNEGAGNLAASAVPGTVPGTFQGTPTWSAGERGWALRCDASGERISWAPASVPVLTRLKHLTVAAWIRPLTTSRVDHVSQWGGSGTRHFNLLTSVTASRWQFYVSRSGIESITTLNTGLSTFTVGRWYFLVGTYDGERGRLYLDGGREMAESGSIPGELLTTSTAAVRVGQSEDGSSTAGAEYGFVGLWNRALSAQAIRNLYLATFGMFRGPVWRRYPGAAPASGLRLLASLGVGA